MLKGKCILRVHNYELRYIMIIYFIFNLNTNVIYEKQEKVCDTTDPILFNKVYNIEKKGK